MDISHSSYQLFQQFGPFPPSLASWVFDQLIPHRDPIEHIRRLAPLYSHNVFVEGLQDPVALVGLLIPDLSQSSHWLCVYIYTYIEKEN